MINTNQIAISIFIGFALVAAAFYFSNTNQFSFANESELHVKRVSNEWVYGNPRAAVSIVEFSDYECPFCARVHPTIKRIVDESEGAVNWHYRHFPLPSHSNAEIAAVIAECVGRNAGNEAFWTYTDTLFSATERFNQSYLEGVAQNLGVTDIEISTCLENEAIREQIEADQITSRMLGGSGTPFSVVVKPDGSVTPVSGALPYENWVAVLQQK